MVVYTRENCIASKRVYEGNIISLRVDQLEREGGKGVKREVVEHNGGVVIACQPTADSVILINQYRYCVDESLVELPAGRIEPGEDPLAAAQRELTEETGYVAARWTELAQMYSAPGFCSELLYLYGASDVEMCKSCPDEDEEIELLELPLAQAWQLIVTGKVRDAKTIAGIGLLMARASKL